MGKHSSFSYVDFMECPRDTRDLESKGSERVEPERFDTDKG